MISVVVVSQFKKVKILEKILSILMHMVRIPYTKF